MYYFILLLLLQTISSCYCQASFTITRFESGDVVESSLTSADYCSSIHGYLYQSKCKCDWRYTFSLDRQRCIDYYNIPRFRFSRQGLHADVSVSVVNIAVGETDAAEPTLEFAASGTPLPVADGLGNGPMPAGCSILSLEFNAFSGWVTNDFTGFSLTSRNSAVYLEVTKLPNEGIELFTAQFARLNITCSGNIADSLMFKFGGTRTFTDADMCEPDPCQNSGSCIASGDSFVCNCTDGFTGELCEIPTDRCEDKDDDSNNDENDCDTSKRTCSSFSVVRMDSGDRVITPLSSVEYCRSIRAYCPDGNCSYCQCEFRLTYRHDLQRCDDYYNECNLRFSRLGLNVDTGVSTVGFVEDDQGVEINFEATPSQLPIVQGPADYSLPSECVVSSLAVNRAAGWIAINHTGFDLRQNRSDTFLQIDETPSLGITFFNSELVRLNITCQGTSYGCLPMKFSGNPKNSNYSVDLCCPNPCNNGGNCTPDGNSFSCSCPPNYSGPLCDDFDDCSTEPCMNGATCTDEVDGYTCTCPTGFSGELCEIPTDSCEDKDDDSNNDENDCDTSKRTCSSFSVVRMDDGDRVNTPLSSVEYCRSIRAYCPDGSCSYCQCEFRLTYRHDLQRCDDYYNECNLRFSRLGLNVDTGVSTVGFVEDDQGVEINFEATPSQLPIVQGPADYSLPSECVVSSLAVNRAAGWIAINHTGFDLRQNRSDTFLQIDETPSLGITFFNSELVRLNITCQGTSYGCLPMKFSGNPKNSNYSVDLCCPNPCNNGGNCTPDGNSFSCSCPPNYSGPLCDDFDDCSIEPCMNGATCTDEVDGYTCTCPTGFSGELCEIPTDSCEDKDDDSNNDENDCDTSKRTCSSFSVVRMDSGDRVNTPLSSVEYCRSIRAYCPDGSCSYCQCEFRLTYRHDLQRCDDYYNECNLRFSRLGLNVDTGVSTVGLVEDDQGVEINFEATRSPLPIVQGPADYSLPSECVVSSLAVNRAAGWIAINHTGFDLRQNRSDTFLQIDETPSLGITFFNSELVRLNITCQGTSYGCLPMKFSGNPKNSNYSVDLCCPNPCNNGGNCTPDGNSFSCSCPPNYSGPLCDDFDDCSTEPCMNGATCTDEVDGYTCTCPTGFSGELCEIPTDSCEDKDDDSNNDENDCDTSKRTCSSFSVVRMDDGDRVNTPLSSVEYCRSIRAYCPDGSCSYCQCEFRLTYRHDLQRCDDYYNECNLRFSRLGLNVDTGVSTVGFVEDDQGVEINFEATPSQLPIVQGPADYSLPSECVVSSLAVNRATGWITVNHSGFGLRQNRSDTFLQIDETPSLGITFFNSELVRLNVTCQGTSYGCLPMKFSGNPKNSNYSVDLCCPNPCNNGGNCTPDGNSFSCSCPPNYSGPLCDDFDDCSTEPCMNGGTCTDEVDGYTCTCPIGFTGELCEIPTDRCEDEDDDKNNDENDCDTSRKTCSSFSVVRMDSGDRVNTPLSSVEYCRSIRAYCPDGSCSYCQCEFRLTYRHDLQRCDDYYNECNLRFSRLGLNVDTGVSTVGFVEDDQGVEINFEATRSQLPIVQGPADYSLPPECVVSSLAVNRAAGWIAINHTGFDLRQNRSDTFLQIDETPSLGITFFNSEFVRLNVTCQGTSYGCLPMKFSGNPKNSNYSVGLCCPNPCNNGGNCTPDGNSFSCSCPPNYSGPLCDDFDDCSTEPCMNGGTCTDEVDGYTCTCPTGFTGANCDNDCLCMNGGNCTAGDFVSDGFFGGFCVCPERFTGDFCELCIFAYTGDNCDEDVDECSIEDPCANGNCSNTYGSFVCNCEDGYDGVYCSEAIEARNSAISDSTSQDETTGTAVGVSVGLVVLLVATAGVIILAMVAYTKYYSRKRKTDYESVAHENPVYYEAVPDNQDELIQS